MIAALAVALLLPLTPVEDPVLVAEAAVWCRTIATTGRLAHDPALVANPRKDWQRLGENVGRGPSVPLVLAAFEKSPTHHAVAHGDWDRWGQSTCLGGGRVYVVQRYQDDRRTK